MSKKCRTPGKLSFNSRGEAYQHLKNLRQSMSIYECSCGKHHLTHSKKNR